MPAPSDVNPKNFKVVEVVYDDGKFAIALGLWEHGDECDYRLGMRWNGEGKDAGYPKLFRHPVWFVLPENLTARMVGAIRDAAHSNASGVENVVRDYIRGETKEVESLK